MPIQCYLILVALTSSFWLIYNLFITVHVELKSDDLTGEMRSHYLADDID